MCEEWRQPNSAIHREEFKLQFCIDQSRFHASSLSRKHNLSSTIQKFFYYFFTDR